MKYFLVHYSFLIFNRFSGPVLAERYTCFVAVCASLSLYTMLNVTFAHIAWCTRFRIPIIFRCARTGTAKAQVHYPATTVRFRIVFCCEYIRINVAEYRLCLIVQYWWNDKCKVTGNQHADLRLCSASASASTT